MKKFYVLIVVCFGLIIQGFGQDYTWIGGASGNWSDDANWSGNGLPDVSGENAIFNSSVVVTFDVASHDIELNSLKISGSGTDVTIISPNQIFKSITVTNTSPLTGALNIGAGATLRLNTGLESAMYLKMAPNSKGIIDGTLYLDGSADEDYVSVFAAQGTSSNTTQVNISSTGTIITKRTGQSILADQDGFLNFNAGSTLRLEDSRPIIPLATYSQSSNIYITGLTTNELTVDDVSIGNLTFDCPGLTALTSLNLPHNITVAGNINVLNTNGQQLVLMANTESVSQQTQWAISILGDLIISNNSRVLISAASDVDQSFTATVRNVSAGGLSMGLQNNNNNAIQSTTLIVKGNIEHTSGTFSAGSTAQNNAADLFVIEMSGNGTQTISSSAGSFDNTGNQVTLKINKPTSTGLVNLLSPLAVGRLNLTSGILRTTSTNYLTVQNTSGQPNVFTSTANSFVEGPLRRVIASTAEQQFATGNGSVKRPLLIKPTTTDQTIFEATLKTGTISGAPSSPLDGIESNYYWEVNRITGTADAEITLTLVGGVSGADAGDAIVVARHDGTNWVRAGRNAVNGFIAPGDLTTGGIISTDEQTSFGAFAFGYGVQASVLPIKLESFNAKKINSSAQINWKISENSNPVSFEIMKSSDGINFSKLGTVAALDGKLNYDFTDNALLNGNNYYRLRMLDKDGIISFSSIVVVMNGTKGVMISSMMPTMVVDRARLNITSSVNGNMQLVIADISGRVIQIQNASIISGNQEVWLNASRLSPGIFQVTGYMNGEKTTTIRFFKR